MQSIHLKPDTLDQENRRFEQAPLGHSLFLNSVPKSGSHLLRNIIRMFVPVEQQYARDFIQYGNLKQHLAAFDMPPKLSWGHLWFSDISAITTSQSRQILLVRDPYSWVLSKARFMLSDEFRGELELLKKAPISSDQLINMVIFGIHQTNPSLKDTYTHNAVAWLGTDIHLVRYEELVKALEDLESNDTAIYFAELLEACGIARPDDWQERVRIGSDTAHSGTASQNLTVKAAELPKELNSTHRRLVDFSCPGLREMLGYS
ncbi:hypothetical protein [Altererythrobacter sp.]|uniref:hypothetical protein n=1 Tax=Altererythrobacter sp. TaxID=1872480 RepID=UPI003D0F8C7E